jgi:hypothetical protein
MSRPFRGISQPQMTHLRPDIILIEHSDPGAEEAHISTNTYALLNEGRMLLMDVNVPTLLPFVRQLSDDGFSPARYRNYFKGIHIDAYRFCYWK